MGEEPERPDGPFAYRGFEGRVGRTFADSDPSWPAETRPADDAPNVVVVLVDDMGYSDVGCFGSEIDTPNIDALAARGVRYTNFHVTPKCSPTRASLLTGVNHHLVGFADVPFHDPGFPGYGGELPADAATIAEHLRDAGYATLMVGKWHLAKESHCTASGPRHSWPLQRGFDEYYGVLGGLSNLHMPGSLVEGNSFVPVDSFPDGYYLTDDITDRAIRMVREHRAADPSRPFFLYVSHLAVHAPLHAKQTDIAKYADRYHAGWDVIRAERHERLVELGILDPEARLPIASEDELEIQPWDSLDTKAKAVFARYAAVYAAMLDSIDQNLGRLCAALEDMDQLDNTLIMFMSDNGATAEGGSDGSVDYFGYIQSRYTRLPDEWAATDSIEEAHEVLDLIGGPRTMPIHPRGWASVSNTPFRLYKSFTHAGGRQVPLIVSWPRKIADHGSLRRQYAHVTDIAPTLFDLLDIEIPDTRHGRRLMPQAGMSLVETLADAAAPSRHDEQYYELAGNRGYYRQGWEIVSRARPGRVLDDDTWELYDLGNDPTETDDLSSDDPDRVSDLAAAWDQAAWTNQVYPVDDKSGLKGAWRNPTEDHLEQPVTLHPGTPTLDRYRSRQLMHTRSFRIVIRLDHGAGNEGTLVSHGDQGGGYIVYVESDRLMFAHNRAGVVTTVSGPNIESGPAEVEVVVEAVGEGRWRIELGIGDTTVTHPDPLPMLWGMTPFQGIDVGIDRRSPVVWELHERRGTFAYSGHLRTVTYEPGDLAPDSPYRASPEDLRRLAHEMANAYD